MPDSQKDRTSRSAIRNPQSAIRTSAPSPFTLVIFGASGDLTRRKLIPAVYHLFVEGLLPDEFAVVGAARSAHTDESFREHLREAMRPADAEAWRRFGKRLAYHRLDYTDPDGFAALRRRLEGSGRRGNCLFYLAVPPAMVAPISKHLHDAGLARRGATGEPWSRIVIEKPFGHDLPSARELNARLAAAFDERQIFRIDHYLGKETVQNILVLRFANSIFEPIWNHKYVDHVQITVSETLGIEGRGRSYEQLGALRDIVQNHVMHLLCLVGMEAPGSLDPQTVRDEKVKLLRALRPIPPECAANGVVRGQYVAGGGLPGYREEKGVAPGSHTETFVAFKAFVDNWRWADVPFYIRTGKRLPARITELSIHFRPVPRVLFNTPELGPMQPNVLAIRIQPHEGISLGFQVKVPGPAMAIEPFQMDFSYADAFDREPPDAYERLLLDAALGDATLFTRSDEVEAAWHFLAPVIEGCALAGAKAPVLPYPAGTWGPKAADDLIRSDGRAWYLARRRN